MCSHIWAILAHLLSIIVFIMFVCCSMLCFPLQKIAKKNTTSLSPVREFVGTLATSIKGNSKAALTHLDLSGNTLDDKGQSSVSAHVYKPANFPIISLSPLPFSPSLSLLSPFLPLCLSSSLLSLSPLPSPLLSPSLPSPPSLLSPFLSSIFSQLLPSCFPSCSSC